MNFRDVLNRAQNAFVIEDYELARQYSEKLVEADPNFLPARILYGNVLIRQELYREGLEQFQKIAGLSPENPEVHNNLGVLYRKLGSTGDALESMNRAFELDTGNAGIAYNIGNLHKQLGDLTEAEKYYYMALDLEPSLVQAYTNLGSVYERRKEYQKALDIYRKGIEIDPNNATLHFNTGVTEEVLGEYQEAEQSYRRALGLNPSFSDALNNLGIVLEKQDRDDEALHTFEELLKKEPENIRGKNNAAVLFAKQGKYDEAEELYRQAVEASPDYLKASKNLGQLKQLRGDHAEAVKHLMNLVRENPDDIEARVLLANVYIEREHFQNAVENLEYVLQKVPDQEAALSSMAKLYEKSGNPEKAGNYLARARRAAPKNRDIHMQEVCFLRNHESTERAIEELEALLRVHPNFFRGQLVLGEMYAETGNHEQAAEILQRIHDRYPRNEEVLTSLVQSQSALGNKQEALSTAEELVHFQREGDDTEEIDRFARSLEIYEQLSQELEEGNRRAVERNLQSFASLRGPLEPEVSGEMEEESLFIDYLPGFESEEVPILDVGGIDPIIAIHEDEEDVFLSEEEEEIPEELPEEKKEEVTVVDKAAKDQSPPAAGQPQPDQPSAPEVPDAPAPQPVPYPVYLTPPEMSPPVPQGPPAPEEKAPPEPEPELELEEEEEPLPEPEPEPELELELEEEEEPLPEPGEEGPETGSEPELNTSGLLGYLERLTRFLPEEDRRRYLQSDMKLKVSSIRARLTGRKGLRQEIESRYGGPEGEKAAEAAISETKLQSTLEYIRGLSKYHPDQETGFALKHTLSGIMKHMRSSKDVSREDSPGQ